MAPRTPTNGCPSTTTRRTSTRTARTTTCTCSSRSTSNLDHRTAANTERPSAGRRYPVFTRFKQTSSSPPKSVEDLGLDLFVGSEPPLLCILNYQSGFLEQVPSLEPAAVASHLCHKPNIGGWHRTRGEGLESISHCGRRVAPPRDRRRRTSPGGAAGVRARNAGCRRIRTNGWLA